MGEYARAREELEEGLSILNDVADAFSASVALSGLGLVAFAEGRVEEARSLLEESLARGREAGEARRSAS